MLKNLSEGLKVIGPHFENNATVQFEKGYLQTGFNYQVKVLLTADEKEKLKALGWTWSTVDECWVFPAYGSTGAKKS